MTSRRGTLVEDGARELLQVHGYSVWVVPVYFNKRFPPAHLVATRPSGDTRLIRIRKISHKAPTVGTVVLKCGLDIQQFRKHQSRYPGESGFHCEIWIYTLRQGFRCFEVLTDSIREIPKLSLVTSSIYKIRGAA